MNQDPVTVIRVDWLRVAPILHLWQAVRMGLRLRVLIPCLLIFGLAGLLPAFSWDSFVRPVNWSLLALFSFPAPADALTGQLVSALMNQAELSGQGGAALLLAAALTSFLGIATGRSAATEFCARTRTGPVAALRFAFRNNLTGATTLLLSVLICTIPFLVWRVAQGVDRMIGSDSVMAQLFAVVPILTVWMMVFTMAVCTVSWLFSLAAIATDGCSASDALSRGINYVLSHKLYVVCVVMVTLVLSNVARCLTQLAIVRASILSSDGPPVAEQVAENHMAVVAILPASVQTGIFLSGMTIAYVLLRNAEDGVQLRELDGARQSEPS